MYVIWFKKISNIKLKYYYKIDINTIQQCENLITKSYHTQLNLLSLQVLRLSKPWQTSKSKLPKFYFSFFCSYLNFNLSKYYISKKKKIKIMRSNKSNTLCLIRIWNFYVFWALYFSPKAQSNKVTLPLLSFSSVSSPSSHQPNKPHYTELVSTQNPNSSNGRVKGFKIQLSSLHSSFSKQSSFQSRSSWTQHFTFHVTFLFFNLFVSNIIIHVTLIFFI